MGDEHVGKRACAHGLGKAFKAREDTDRGVLRSSRMLCSSCGAVRVGAGDDGICDPRGSHSAHGNPRHHPVPSAASRAVECDCRGNKRSVRNFAEHGQSTVEFAVIAAACAAVCAGLAALWHLVGSGALVEHALAVASHHLQGVAPATVVDLFLY